MKQFYVYFHCKPDGTPFYVGKGCGYRAYDLYRYCNQHYNSIVAKYGKENIKIEVQPCIDEQEAFDLEILCIQSLREDGINLCNCTDGGEGSSGYKHTDKARASMSQKRIGKKYALGNKFTSEQRAAQSKRMLGKQYALGYHHTPAALLKISEKSKSLWCTPEGRAFASKRAKSGWTPERLATHSKRMKELWTPERRAKQSERSKFSKTIFKKGSNHAPGNTSAVGTIWINNGLINKRIKSKLPEGWVRGKLHKTK